MTCKFAGDDDHLIALLQEDSQPPQLQPPAPKRIKPMEASEALGLGAVIDSDSQCCAAMGGASEEPKPGSATGDGNELSNNPKTAESPSPSQASGVDRWPDATSPSDEASEGAISISASDAAERCYSGTIVSSQSFVLPP